MNQRDTKQAVHRIRMATTMLVAVAVSGLLGCQSRRPAAGAAGTPLQLLKDQRYGTGPSQTYDLYWKGEGPAAPVVMIVHYGGGFQGDKADYTPGTLGARLAEEGLTVASINYRLAPRYVWPAPVDDVREALRYFKERYGKVFAIGLSAGGWFTEQAALTPSAAPAGLISVAGLHDAAINSPWPSRELAGTDPRRASPIRYVKSGFPPTLLIHGTADLIVPFNQSVRMRNALKSCGVEVRLVALRGKHHFGPEQEFFDAFYPYVISWLREHL